MRRPAVPIAYLLAVVAAVVAAVPIAAAGAATTPLNWTEKLSKDKATRMTFRIGTLSTTAKGWSATVELVNTGSVRVLVQRTQFGIAEYETKTDFASPLRFLRATTLAPAPPTVLAPGKTWKGTIGGAGKPNVRLYVRLVFGPFVTPGAPTGFTWITDHARHVFSISI